MTHHSGMSPPKNSPRQVNDKFGVSFSLKQCRNFGLAWQTVLEASLNDLGVRRFRLMSYWNEHEHERGVFDFTDLDKQIDMIEQAGGIVTLCLGARQPRWPESHWPDWAWDLSKEERTTELMKFVQAIVERYRNRSCIISWQLENEALLERWGDKGEVDRKRLRTEYKLVKRLDPTRPVVMTTSTSWGIPIRRPIPDIVGFSYYRTLYRDGAYHRSLYYPWVFKLRALLIRLLHWKPTFIHEMQAEPWGPKNIWEMSPEEQDKSMSIEQLRQNIALAQKTRLYPIDLWGVEWWYWLRANHNDPSKWNIVKQLFTVE